MRSKDRLKVNKLQRHVGWVQRSSSHSSLLSVTTTTTITLSLIHLRATQLSLHSITTQCMTPLLIVLFSLWQLQQQSLSHSLTYQQHRAQLSLHSVLLTQHITPLLIVLFSLWQLYQQSLSHSLTHAPATPSTIVTSLSTINTTHHSITQ